MQPTFTVKGNSAFQIIEGLPEKVRDRFAESIRKIEEQILSEARAAAVAHFHTVGIQPGRYLAGFKGGVKVTDSRVVGWVRNNNNLSHLMEGGTKPHDILPKAADVLAFLGSAEMVFAKLVKSPGMEAFPALVPAFEAHKAEVEAAAREAVKQI